MPRRFDFLEHVVVPLFGVVLGLFLLLVIVALMRAIYLVVIGG